MLDLSDKERSASGDSSRQDPWLEESRRAVRVQTAAMYASIAGNCVLLTIAFIIQMSRANPPPGALLCIFFVSVPLMIPLGALAGWLAHRFFHHTKIPVFWMAMLFVLLVDLCILGWMLVLFLG